MTLKRTFEKPNLATGTPAVARARTTGVIPSPNWARRSSRALPKVRAPRLHRDHSVFRKQRPLAVLLIARSFLSATALVVAIANGWWLALAPLTALVYGGTLTAVHHLIHGSLGLSPRVRTIWLSLLAMLVTESGHALQVTHLAHHRSNPEVPDPEGYIENVTWKQLPIAALAFRYRLMWWGWRRSPRRHRVGLEMAVHCGAHIGSLALLPFTAVPWIYLSLIHLASFTFALLAGKGPQTNWGRPISSPFVRVHTFIGGFVFLSHDQHLEHHIYPKVPLPRLRRLQAELETVYAELDVVNVKMGI